MRAAWAHVPPPQESCQMDDELFRKDAELWIDMIFRKNPGERDGYQGLLHTKDVAFASPSNMAVVRQVVTFFFVTLFDTQSRFKRYLGIL